MSRGGKARLSPQKSILSDAASLVLLSTVRFEGNAQSYGHSLSSSSSPTLSLTPLTRSRSLVSESTVTVQP